jgi:hypothetical protein
MELTQSQRILLDAYNKKAVEIGEEDQVITEQEFLTAIEDKDHDAHFIVKIISDAMETYGKAKWEECYNAIRDRNTLETIFILPEFKA